MKPIYSNGAVSKLTSVVSLTDTSISVSDGSLFPNPSAGDEEFSVTLVGNVSLATEILLVTARAGNVMTVLRGQQGTSAQAFSPGDQAYHALTAIDADRFRDAMQYYLAPSTSDHTTGRYGQPLEAGMMYYNIANNAMREYTGTVWRGFATSIEISAYGEFLWEDLQIAIAPGGPVLWPDDLENVAPDYSPTSIISVFREGAKLQPVGGAITQGFTATNVGGKLEIILTEGADIGDELSISEGVAADNSGFIDRTEQDASSFGFTIDEDDFASNSDGHLPTQQSTKAYVDSAVLGASRGYKNVLINSDERVDQRGFFASGGNWGSLPDNTYGPDRWLKLLARLGSKIQVIEPANLVVGQPYTLSWVGGTGNGEIVDGAGNSVANGASGISGVITDVGSVFPAYVVVPDDATFMQFERGGIGTSYEHRAYGLELGLCLRYYFSQPGVAQYAYNIFFNTTDLSDPTPRSLIINFPEEMRVTPTITHDQAGWAAGAPTVGAGDAYVRFIGEPVTMGGSSSISNLIADAEYYF